MSMQILPCPASMSFHVSKVISHTTWYTQATYQLHRKRFFEALEMIRIIQLVSNYTHSRVSTFNPNHNLIKWLFRCHVIHNNCSIGPAIIHRQHWPKPVSKHGHVTLTGCFMKLCQPFMSCCVPQLKFHFASANISKYQFI